MPSYAHVSAPPGSYYQIKANDWGDLAPGTNNGEGTWGAANLAYNASGGSLAMGTAYVEITYITAQGESLPSAEASKTISAGSGAVTITLPTTPPANALGWRVYSGSSSGGELLNVSGASTTQAQQNFSTTQGTLAGFPIATTAVQVLVYGAGAAVPTINKSGIQPALPSIGAATTADIYLIVSRNYRCDREVLSIRPSGIADVAGVALEQMDCIGPTWKASTAITVYQGASVAQSSFLVLSGVLFACTTAGTTASTVPTFNFAIGGTTTDGTAVWTCIGYRGLVRMRWSNATSGSLQPAAQEYDLYQP
jgi:hypothetical protein